MDEIKLTGFTTEEAENIRKAANEYAERTVITIEEAIQNILTAIRYVADAVLGEFNKLKVAFRKLAEEWDLIDTEPRARRRKQERARARMIEERYRAEIRRVEKTKIYRRIYKPP